MLPLGVAVRAAVRRSGWHVIPRRWESTVVQNASGQDRDPRLYLTNGENLLFLRSPRNLMYKAEVCLDLCTELMEYIKVKKETDPVACLEIMDTMNNLMCLTLDPAEAVVNLHPREEYREYATKAMNYLQRYMTELNTNRIFLEPISRIVSNKEIWDELTPQQQYHVLLLWEDMKDVGSHLPETTKRVVYGLMERKDSLEETYDSSSEHMRDTTQILGELVQTRNKLATVLEQRSYAHLVLKNSLIGTPGNVWRFLLKYAQHLSEKAKSECATLLEHKKPLKDFHALDSPQAVLTDFEKRDLGRFANHNRHADVSAEFKEYLSVANAWNGLQLICRELFGVVLEKQSFEYDFEQYDPYVQKYVLKDTDGSLIGYIYADLITRPEKPLNAGHYTVQLGAAIHPTPVQDLDLVLPESNRQIPIVIFTCNAKGAQAKQKVAHAEWENILLAPDELLAMFHEFGHVLHTMFGQAGYQNLSGTRSSMDYIEIFSHLFENFARDHRVLRKFAKHHKTGLPVPKELVDRFLETEVAFGALEQLDHIVLACIDQVYHGMRPLAYYLTEPGSDTLVHIPIEEGEEDPLSLAQTIAKFLTPVQVTEIGWQRGYYLQLFSAFPGTYYSYTLARVISDMIWERYFAEFPLTPKGGKVLREVLSLGASDTPENMLKTCFGEEWSVDSFLRDL